MSDIRINKVGNIQPEQIEKKIKKAEQAKEQETYKVETNKKDPGEVLEYMANSGALNKSKIQNKKIDINKHVDSESQQRIEKMMKAFDETILKSAEMAIEEFGLSEKEGQDVAIMAFHQKFLV